MSAAAADRRRDQARADHSPSNTAATAPTPAIAHEPGPRAGGIASPAIAPIAAQAASKPRPPGGRSDASRAKSRRHICAIERTEARAASHARQQRADAYVRGRLATEWVTRLDGAPRARGRAAGRRCATRGARAQSAGERARRPYRHLADSERPRRTGPAVGHPCPIALRNAPDRALSQRATRRAESAGIPVPSERCGVRRPRRSPRLTSRGSAVRVRDRPSGKRLETERLRRSSWLGGGPTTGLRSSRGQASLRA